MVAVFEEWCLLGCYAVWRTDIAVLYDRGGDLKININKTTRKSIAIKRNICSNGSKL
jgi:hypothetical protein